MKRLLAHLVFCGLLAFASSAWSLTIQNGAIDVGGFDTLFSSAFLANSGDQKVLDWVKGEVGESDVTFSGKYDFGNYNLLYAIDTDNGWAFELVNSPTYFLIKTGKAHNEPGDPTHFLFKNNASLNWAVINFAQLDILEIQTISHTSSFDGAPPVPEPATLLLLGSGLAGMAAWRRRKAQ